MLGRGIRYRRKSTLLTATRGREQKDLMNLTCNFARPARWARARLGFSLVEVTVTLGLVGILVIAGFNMVTLMERSSRRQALHTTALELAQGRIEELRATVYNPPLAPYTATNTILTTNAVLSLARTGTNSLVSGLMRTVIAPVADGHLVTVTVSTTNLASPITVQLQTLINKKAGGQP